MVTVNFYKITDKLTNQSYIGCTTRLYQRIAYHFCKGDNITGEVNERFKKYGCDKSFFDVEVLSTVTTDSEELIREMEKNYMKKYKTLENGMNKASGSEGYPPRLAGPRLGDDYKRSLTVAIEEDLKDKLFIYCKSNRISRSRLVEKILANLEREERKCNRTSKK